MRRMIAMACVLATISGGALAQNTGAQAPAPRKTHALTKKTHASTKKKALTAKKASAKEESSHVKAVAPAQPVPAQAMPPIPATLMNSAPVAPNVTMADGLLTIDAPNSILSAVLDGVHKSTGAVVEGASPTERVAVRLGPGNPRQVIAALLQGTPYDYVILGSQEGQEVVTRIVLTPASASSSAQNTPGAGHPTQPSVNPLPDRPPEPADDAAAQPAAEPQADQTEQPQPQPPTQPPTPQNQPNTPEQLFKELQGLQQPQPPK
jgi:hypothetical protein